ncbi:MAG TPA: hypothetical protein VLJ59_03410 [Mycobacteriales bacterium]|nr:hypothetical protein [Mycobacteriales bacterium]
MPDDLIGDGPPGAVLQNSEPGRVGASSGDPPGRVERWARSLSGIQLLLAALTGVVVAAGGLFAAISHLGHDGTVPPSPTTTQTAQPSTSPPANRELPGGVDAVVRRQENVRLGAYEAIDLDAEGPGWLTTSVEWTTQDVGYWADNKSDGLWSRFGTAEEAVVGVGSRWTYADCVSAPYGRPGSVPAGRTVSPGHAVCVRTSEGRYALLVITGVDPGSPGKRGALVVTVTVWENPS